MKEGIHPAYREIVVHDLSCDFKFITRSTVQTREMTNFEGKEYPLLKVEVSSESHPFYTGKQKLVDSGGRVERFQRRYGKVRGTHEDDAHWWLSLGFASPYRGGHGIARDRDA